MEGLAEEKKEVEVADGAKGEREQSCEGEEDEVGEEDDELVDLPAELSGLSNKTYGHLDDLELDLIERGFPDLPVVLDPKSGKARLRMTSGAHDKVTDEYTHEFNKLWGKDRWGRASESTNVFIQPLPGRKPTRRKPDIAFWGYNKCDFNEKGLLNPKDLTLPPKFHATREQTERVNPDVVFQFSGGNAEGYEIKAIDDMMNRALVVYVPHQPNNEAPRLGFLVKLRTHRGKRTRDNRKKLLKVDVYRIPRGATFQDAKANRNGASHASYAPGQQDVVLEITAKDLGIEGFWAMFCRSPYKISAKAIYEALV
jgi:hypothetical protein